MKSFGVSILVATALGALAGLFSGSLIEDLDQVVHLFRPQHPHIGVCDRAVAVAAGAVGGFGGFGGGVICKAYRAACDGAARDDWGRYVARGVVLAVVIGLAVIVSVGDFGLTSAVGGFAVGAVVGAIIADV